MTCHIDLVYILVSSPTNEVVTNAYGYAKNHYSELWNRKSPKRQKNLQLPLYRGMMLGYSKHVVNNSLLTTFILV